MNSNSIFGKLLGKVKTFDTLRYYPDFRWLWASNLFYQISWWMQLLVMSWLAYELTGSALMVAIFTAARLFPTLLAPFVGAIADKVNRRNLLIAVQCLQIANAAALAILISTDLLEFWQLMISGFITGVAWSVFYTTAYPLSIDIVGKENITNAVALNSVAMYSTSVIGPTISGLLTANIGPANCFWLSMVMSICSIGFLAKMQSPAKAKVENEGSVLQDLADGFKFVIHSRNLLSVLSITLTANIFMWPAFQSFMPVFAKDNLGQGPEGYGFLLTAMGVGSFIGSLTIASIGNIRRKGLLFITGTTLLAIFFGSFAVMESFPAAMVLIALSGMAGSAFDTMQSTITLSLAPEEMRARCMGFLSMAIGVYFFGSLGMGAIANVFGASMTTAIASAIMVVILAVITLSLPNLRKI